MVRLESALTLVCAEDDELALVQVIQALEDRGIGPEIVPGADREPRLLGRAVDRGKPGLFLVCRSRLIDDAAYRRLEGLFSARRGPGQDLDAVVIDTSPKGVERTVDAILERVAAFTGQAVTAVEGEEDEAPAEGTEANLRDVVELRGVGGLSAPGAERSHTPAPETKKPGPSAERATRTADKQGGVRRSAPEVRETGKPSTRKTGRGRPKGRKAAPEQPVARGGRREREPEAQDKLGAEGREPNWLVPLVAVAVLCFGAVLVYRFVIAPGRHDVAADGARGAPPVARTASPSPTSEGDGGGAASGRVEDTLDTGGPRADLGDGAGGGAGLPDGGGQPPGTTTAGEGGADAAEVPASPEDVEARIDEAIAAEKMRALDLLLVLPMGRASAWHEATDYCAMKRISGVGGFRLPTVKELRKLRRARMLPIGDVYWSSSLDKNAGDGEDHVLAVTVKNRIAATAKTDTDGRPVCVRPR